MRYRISDTGIGMSEEFTKEVFELKDMVRAYHSQGIEVVLEMPFVPGISANYVTECLRFYMLEYHVDGFVLNP